MIYLMYMIMNLFSTSFFSNKIENEEKSISFSSKIVQPQGKDSIYSEHEIIFMYGNAKISAICILCLVYFSAQNETLKIKL